MTAQAPLQTDGIEDATDSTDERTEESPSGVRGARDRGDSERNGGCVERATVAGIVASAAAASAEAIARFNALAENSPAEVLATVWESLEIRRGWNGTLHTLVDAHLWQAMLDPRRAADETRRNLPVFEATCRALYGERRGRLTPFVRLAELQRASIKSNAPGCSPSDGPLYKRAASALPRPEENAEAANAHVDLLLSSCRPRAVLRALQLLLRLGEAETAVTEATVRSKRSPLFRVEALRLFLAEVGRGRLLDTQLDRIFSLCPSTVTAEEAIRELLRGMAEDGDVSAVTPFLFDAPSLTLGMVKPLLVRLLSDDGNGDDDDDADDEEDGTSWVTEENQDL